MTFSDDSLDPIDPIGRLDAAQTRWLVAEARKVLSDLGLGQDLVLIEGGALQTGDGRTIGLVNLSRTLRLLPRKKWPRALRQHLTALVQMDPAVRPAPDQLRPKLLPSDMVTVQPIDYQPLEPLPGVVAVLSAQGNGATAVYGTLDQIDMGRDEAFDVALSNLASLRLPRWSRRRVDKHLPNSWVEFLDSPDACGAARVLLLPEMFRRLLKQPMPSCGVLVAVPTKHELWIHVPRDRDGMLRTALAMAGVAYETWVAEAHPITPDIFLISPDMHARTLLRPDPEGVTVDEMIMLELLDALDPGCAEAS